MSFRVPKAKAFHHLGTTKEIALYWAGNMIYVKLFECKCVLSTLFNRA